MYCFKMEMRRELIKVLGLETRKAVSTASAWKGRLERVGESS